MKSTYIYPSAFSSSLAPNTNAPTSPSESGTGLASLICHVAHLERSLEKGTTTRFFYGNKIKVGRTTVLGSGASFMVEKAEILQETTAPLSKAYVAIKTVRETDRTEASWTDVLLEIRSLLHEPLRYHPNIVRLLDIGWGSVSGTDSLFPSLILEYAEYGTLANLQLNSSSPLPFSIKQKLCYDVGRGLSILHACGVIHGDVKHENVLVFANACDQPAGQPYTAKLADFGGAVMDMERQATHRMRMGTIPFEAPEIESTLTADGVKRTDAYSFGMLVWRCMIDCRDVLHSVGMSKPRGGAFSDEDKRRLKFMKTSDGLLEKAIGSVSHYFITQSLPIECLHMIVYVLTATLRSNPSHRALDRAQARLRGMNTETVHIYIQAKDAANARHLESNRRRVPGSHGITLESTGYALGRLGEDFDVQNNLPGYRPDLPHPDFGGYLFEPLKLRKLLRWELQLTVVEELQVAARAKFVEGSSGRHIEPWAASFFLFQCYLVGFGVVQDFGQACHWLHLCSQTDEGPGAEEYLAQAWLTRVCDALGQSNPLDLEAQLARLCEGILRGHRHCYHDATVLIEKSHLPNAAYWRNYIMVQGVQANRILTGGTGMPHFVPRKLTRRWDLDDLAMLDVQLREVLGGDYESCLRNQDKLHQPLVVPDGGFRFDRILVNHMGHGLLHLAATYGKVNALRHLIRKYNHNIDSPDQSYSHTPLVCACQAGQYKCALVLLDEGGADPNGHSTGQETPLHCLAHFDEEY